MSPEECSDALARLCERVIDALAMIAMDTPEDQALHDRAVATFRDCLARLTEGAAS